MEDSDKYSEAFASQESLDQRDARARRKSDKRRGKERRSKASGLCFLPCAYVMRVIDISTASRACMHACCDGCALGVEQASLAEKLLLALQTLIFQAAEQDVLGHI